VGCVQAAMMALFVAGNKLTTAASAIYLQSTAPLYVLLLSPIALGERIRRADLGYLAAFALGLALFLVRTDDRQATAPEPFLGNLVAAAGGLGWALTILGLRWLAADRRATGDGGTTGDRRATAGRGGSGNRPGSVEPAAAATVLANAAVAAACLPWLAAAPSRIAVADWTAILWLGVFQVGLAYVLLARAVRYLPAFEVAMLTLVEPVLSPLWAWLLHGERPGAWALAGGGLILATGALRTWSGARRA
jgi:drug/metabolite transporter (DMT)-like permease